MSASTIALKPLSSDAAAKLSHIYSIKRNISITSEKSREISEKCQNNPLAIRLAIDSYGLGRDLNSAISYTSEQIADYSYSNLIDALSPNAMLIMETIFIEEELTRNELRDILDITIDEISLSVSELLRTSLVDRKEVEGGVETLFLSPGVKDLVLGNHRNIEFRRAAKKAIKQAESTGLQVLHVQKISGVHKYGWPYIGADVPPSLASKLHSEFGVLKGSRGRYSEFVSSKRRLDALRIEFPNVPEIYAYLAWAHHKLEDTNSAIQFADQAIIISNGSIRFLCMKAIIQRQVGMHSDSAKTNNEIINSENFREMTVDAPEMAAGVVAAKYQSIIYAGDYDQVCAQTEEWSSGIFPYVEGSARAWALKRISETIGGSAKKDNLLKSIEIMSQIKRVYGPKNEIINIVNRNLIEEIIFMISRGEIEGDSGLKFLIYADYVIVDAYEKQREQQDRLASVVGSLASVDISGNPFRLERWESLVKTILVDRNESDLSQGIEVGSDYMLAEVTNIPKGNDSYIFAKNVDGLSFFLHRKYMEQSQMHLWVRIKVGQGVEVIPSKIVQDGKAIRANYFRLKN